MTHPEWRSAISPDRLADYFPAWLNNLADDVVLEGSAMDGTVQGAEPVRTILVYIRSLYEYQRFHFAGPYGEDGFLEDYPPGSAASRSITSPWSPATPPGRHSTSWATTGPGARCCSCPG